MVDDALRVEGLNKTYANGVRAVQDISFRVASGEFFALLGPNGAGKSTTIGIITSLVTKSSGKVYVCGQDTDTEFESARKNIGLVPQEFNFNVFEPIIEILINQGGYYGIPRRLARQRAEYYLHKLGLWDKRKDSPRLLSGGMKRRLMIARALVHEPCLLILDEPTAGVDIEIRYTMWDFFRELNARGVTIILTTHYLEEAENLCRHIVIINHGRIVEDASTRELIDKLGAETFVLDIKPGVAADRLPAEVELDCARVQVIDGRSLEVQLRRNCSLNQLFVSLDEKGIEVISMRNKTNRLEQVFFCLTRESAAPGPGPDHGQRKTV